MFTFYKNLDCFIQFSCWHLHRNNSQNSKRETVRAHLKLVPLQRLQASGWQSHSGHFEKLMCRHVFASRRLKESRGRIFRRSQIHRVLGPADPVPPPLPLRRHHSRSTSWYLWLWVNLPSWSRGEPRTAPSSALQRSAVGSSATASVFLCLLSAPFQYHCRHIQTHRHGHNSAHSCEKCSDKQHWKLWFARLCCTFG